MMLEITPCTLITIPEEFRAEVNRFDKPYRDLSWIQTKGAYFSYAVNHTDTDWYAITQTAIYQAMYPEKDVALEKDRRAVGSCGRGVRRILQEELPLYDPANRGIAPRKDAFFDWMMTHPLYAKLFEEDPSVLWAIPKRDKHLAFPALMVKYLGILIPTLESPVAPQADAEERTPQKDIDDQTRPRSTGSLDQAIMEMPAEKSDLSLSLDLSSLRELQSSYGHLHS